jgi:hypothetical protein
VEALCELIDFWRQHSRFLGSDALGEVEPEPPTTIGDMAPRDRRHSIFSIK